MEALGYCSIAFYPQQQAIHSLKFNPQSPRWFSLSVNSLRIGESLLPVMLYFFSNPNLSAFSSSISQSLQAKYRCNWDTNQQHFGKRPTDDDAPGAALWSARSACASGPASNTQHAARPLTGPPAGRRLRPASWRRQPNRPTVSCKVKGLLRPGLICSASRCFRTVECFVYRWSCCCLSGNIASNVISREHGMVHGQPG